MLWVGSKACESDGQDPTGIQQVGHECQVSVGMSLESHISCCRSQILYLGLKQSSVKEATKALDILWSNLLV